MNKIIQIIITIYIIILLFSSFYNLAILNFAPIYLTVIFIICSTTLGVLAIKGVNPKYFNPKTKTDLISIVGFLIICTLSTLLSIKVGYDLGISPDKVAPKTFNALFILVPIIYLIFKRQYFVKLDNKLYLRLIPLVLTLICIAILSFSIPYLLEK